MNETVKAALEAELAGIERVLDPPAAPFGYGRDLSCARDLADDMREVDPFTTEGLAEAIVRRLDCPRGALLDDPDYGIDLRSAANRGFTTAQIQALAGQIRSELLKDDRLLAVRVTVRPSSTGSTLRIELAVEPADARVDSFELVLAASSAEVLLEEMRG